MPEITRHTVKVAAHERSGRVAGRGRVLVLVLAVVALMAVGGSAGAQAGSVISVTGSGTATGVLSSCGGSGLIRFVFDGTGDLSPFGPITTHAEACTDTTDTSGPTTPILPGGTFTITAAAGTLSGTVTGTGSNVATPQGYPVYNLLTVTSGTGQFAGATGTLETVGFAQFPPSSFAGTTTGTLVLPSQTAQARSDCKKGGWENLVDAHGQPFRNQGQCVSSSVTSR